MCRSLGGHQAEVPPQLPGHLQGTDTSQFIFNSLTCTTHVGWTHRNRSVTQMAQMDDRFGDTAGDGWTRQGEVLITKVLHQVEDIVYFSLNAIVRKYSY